MNKTINEATGSEIELDNDYTYDGSSDSEFKDGIIISKSLTINGNGKTINANGQARIFNITSGADVIIKNLILINGKADKGGAIYADGGNYKIENTTFAKNTPANFIIENNVIKLNQADGFITVGNFTIITDNDEIHGSENLTNYTIPADSKNVKLILNGADGKTVNNIFIIKETKEIDITSYSGLVAAFEDAKNTKYDQYIINLLPGDYNVTQDMVWENSATREIVINGNNNTLDGQGMYQFLRTGNNHNLVVENITFTNFKITKTDENDNVPGNGAVFYINGKLTANNARFINNWAIKRGGAIYNYGTLILNNTIFENNIASRYDGGAIANYGPLTISNSIFRSNTATDQGGAIYIYYGTLSVTQSVFENNKAGSKGVATFKIKKLTKKGKYKAEIAFKGDGTYKASKKTIKLTIK